MSTWHSLESGWPADISVMGPVDCSLLQESSALSGEAIPWGAGSAASSDRNGFFLLQSLTKLLP